MLRGALVALLVGFVVYLFVQRASDDETPIASVEETSEAAEEVVAEIAPEPELVPEEVPAAPVPEFDTFRVDPDGAMVIAGRAEPDQVVDIILGGEAIERVTADASGSFVALPMAGFSDIPRRLSLLADPEGAAIASTTSYIVAPIIAPLAVAEAPVLQAEPEPEPEVVIAQETTDDEIEVASAEPPAAPEAPVLPEIPQTEEVAVSPAQPTVLESDADGVRVVQAGPSIDAPTVTDNVALDAITYDPDGEVQLSGRATGDGEVQVYINNEPISTSEVTQGGDWRIDLPEIDTGVYTLRIDELDVDGDVVSRVETPFKREEPEEVAAVLAEETSQEGFEVAVRTVQPGSTLWAIAEESLGDGIRYVEVFEANRDLIRDPDLIYPGQIFRMPEATQ